MPELPEVHTTVEGLKRETVGKTIEEIWSDFHIGTSQGERQTIKNEKYFKNFKKTAEGAKIISVERRGKNILINLDNAYTIIIHMKMTGHLMVGKYKKAAKTSNALKKYFLWKPVEEGPLQDPYNKYIHLVFSLSDGHSKDPENNKHLVLSDMRKFASVTLSKTEELHLDERVGKLGEEPLDPKFTPQKLSELMRRKKGTPIKSALLDQSSIAGIGNIYSDEILWETGIHPLSQADKIPDKKFKEIFDSMRKILRFSIRHGGDSKSDYRNIFGEKGGFQDFHKAYGKGGLKCPKPGCGGIIEKLTIRGRTAHFCPKHQIKYER